ncbi:MAG: LLM class flavin-dependent oxidoreductase [Stigonema ocellatum SAG 48.90 = DSM 106950]|nr:LLM class flavin-dependent oxidoreductase [Stigonema ocellatum SAG 48.90 = DSM 106950]
MLYDFGSILEILQYRSIERSESSSYIFLSDGETESGNLSYGELDRRAIAIATHLKSWQGERALLLYPSGLEFITAFFGCLYAGVVAVPVYPPRRNQKLHRLLSIVNDAQAKVALTTTSILADFEKRWEEEAELAQLKWVATDTIEANALEFVPKSVTRESLAFLQYTSGSTGTPKGVMVSHGNIIHNQQLIHQAFGHSEKSIGVGWLPLFHDMGLIGHVLQPIYVGFPSILMPPVAFLQKPICWLKAISKYRATTSGGPNFAYDLCVKKVQPEQLANLDLSSWDLAFNGAEPVRAETLKQFAEKFAPSGFNYSAFYPCYGMAETTLFTTGGDKNQQPVIQGVKARELEQNSVVENEISSPLSRVFVGCGRPYMDTTVIIVNPESLTRSREGFVGEIWVEGGSIASGYWNRPESTQETFQAYLKDTGDGPFLRTGDLGFLRNGELFVTGRLKDVIIIYGRNHYPQDIELTVQKSHPALQANCGAAFSIEIEGEERLVVVQELERTYVRQLNSDEVVEAINQAVSLEHEVVIDTIVLLKPGSIPKTSSGKIQRSACRQKFLDESLQNVVFTKSVQKVTTQVSPFGFVKSQKSKVKGIEFSLLYFSSNEAEFTDHKYRLLLEGAKFADQNNFHAVWIPERHFHPFGGLYPEPAVLGSALAMVTEKIRIRPGSVVLPLQNPVRVAEQWSVVDNLSGGRVDISFARGWNPNDFVLLPENYTNRTQVMFDGIKTVQKLWRGESVYLPNGNGEETEIRIYPLPKQPELPIWITCSGGKERFVEAGAIGGNVLTALLFQPMEELASKIALYRESRAKNGYDPNSGHVTLMLHTFVSSEIEFVRSKVKQPFREYLQSSIDLWRNNSESLDELIESEREKLLAYAFERYFQTAALLGTPSSCLKMVNQLKEIGIDEIACLIDFGVDADSVLSNLDYLNQLREFAGGISVHETSQKVEQLAINPIEQKQWGAEVKIGQQDITATLNNGLSQNTHKNSTINQDKFPTEVDRQADDGSTTHGLQKIIIQHIADSLNIHPESVDLNKSLFALGVDSLKAVELIEIIGKYLKIPIAETLLFEYPTIAQLSKYLVELHGLELQNCTPVEEESKSKMDNLDQQADIDSFQGIEVENYQKLAQGNLKNSQRITGKL